MSAFDSIKKYVEDKFLVHFDLKLMGKEALEALAFVLINQLEKVIKAAELTALEGPLQSLKEKADMIDGEKDRT